MEMSLLKNRLRKFGYQTLSFRYFSTQLSLKEIAEQLNAFITQISNHTVHFVGHSLGGLVVLKLFEIFPDQQPPGRIIVLGTPYQGCETVRRFICFPGIKHIIGPGIIQLIEGNVPIWSGKRDLGVIAGTLNIGLGRLIGAVAPPGDGTIRLEETHIPGSSDSIALPVSHTGLLFSKKVVKEAHHFLKYGRFSSIPLG